MASDDDAWGKSILPTAGADPVPFPEPPPPYPPPEPMPPAVDIVPPPEPLPPTPFDVPPPVEPLFGQILADAIDEDDEECEQCDPCHRLFNLGIHRCTGDEGIGHERVVFAPFEIDATQPMSNFRLTFQSWDDIRFPDRSEYWWAAPRRGPKFPEISTDIQEIRLYNEVAIDSNFALFSEYPLRLVDPVLNGNTAGFGDMSVGNKAVLINGEYWQITQYFRTTTPTGSPKKGLGTGHTSLEPGLLVRYMWTPRTYLHAQAKYWIPIASDPMYRGEVLTWAFGVSTIAYETDVFAALPTLEFVGTTFFDGMKTEPPPVQVPNLPGIPAIPGIPLEVDGENFFTVNPGVRFVLGPDGDLGLFEVGMSGAISADPDQWHEGMVRLDLRWSY